MPSELNKIGASPEAEITGYIDFTDALNNGAYVTDGADLVSGENNAQLYEKLVGVPFAITKFQFRSGTGFKMDGKLVEQDYVTVSATMGDAAFMQRRGVDVASLPSQLEPGNRVLFNDGSTGIKRNVVEFLSRNKFIVLPQPVIIGGAKGESTYDLTVKEWKEVLDGYVEVRDDGTYGYTLNLPKPFICPRGLRFSEYPNPLNEKELSRTYYLG